jgi:hypothetical protein
LLLLAALAPVILALQPANVDAQKANVDAPSVRPPQRPPAQTTEKEKMNAWTVGLAGGLLEGAPIRLAAEIARFVDYLFSRIDRLQAPGFDPKWKSINLAATVPGLFRFSAAQEWLDRKARNAQAPQ